MLITPPQHGRRGTRLLACIAFAATLAALLAGCGAMQGAKNIVKGTFFATVDTLKITTQSDTVTNADDRGAPLPVTVRIYELSDATPLRQTDYASLLERDQEVLATSLVQRYEYVAFPQSTTLQEFAIKPGTRFLAVLAVMRKTPLPVYYLLDVKSLETSGISLRISEQNMVITQGPEPLNKGTEGAPSTPAVQSPPPASPPPRKADAPAEKSPDGKGA